MTPQQLQALKDELTNDPLTRNYAALSDAQAAASLNAQDRPANVDLSALRLLVFNQRHNSSGNLRGITSVWLLLDDLKDGKAIAGAAPNGDTPTPLQVDSARLMIKLLELDVFGDTFDFSGNNLDALLSQLVAADAMPQSLADQINALSNNQRSRAQELRLGRVFPIDVQEARALP